MLRKEDLKHVSELIESFKPKITYFEREILIPSVIDRLKYVAQIFGEFKKLCADTTVATHIDAPLRTLVDPRVFKLGAPEPKVGAHYLSIISNQCEEEFIKPITELLAKHPLEKATGTIEGATNFLNDATNLCQSIVGCKDKLFLYSLRAFLNVKNLNTGEVLLGAPTELSLILMPFQTRLEELMNVASTTIQSVNKWAEQIGQQKTKQVELISHLTQVKAIQWNFWCQVAVIVLTIVLVWASQRANLYLEKRDLEETVAELKGDIRKHEEFEQGNKKKVLELELALKEARSRPVPKGGK